MQTVKKQTVKIRITGPIGSGKSLVATMIARALEEYGFQVTSDEPRLVAGVYAEGLKKFDQRKESIPIHSRIRIELESVT